MYIVEFTNEYDARPNTEKLEDLRIKCRRNKISNKDIAAVLGVVPSTISGYFNGKCRITSLIVGRLNHAVNYILENKS